MPDRDPIDEFIALPQDQQLSTLQKLAPEKQDALLAQVKQRKGKPTSPPPVATSSASIPGPLEPHGGFMDILRGAGSGIYNMIAHPLLTGQGMVQGAMASGMSPTGEGYPSTAATGRMEDLKANQEVQQQAQQGQAETGQFMKEHPLFSAGNVLGPALLIHGLAKGGGAVLDTAGDAVRGTIKNATNTTPSDVAGIVRDQSEKNVPLTQKAAEFQRKQQAVLDAQKAEQARQTTQAQARRTYQEQGARLVNRVQDVAKNAKAKIDALYDDLRQKTSGATAEPEDVGKAVQNAENKIKGSSENLKIFRDILSKNPDTTAPESIEYQGAQIPKGHALYDVLLEMGKEGSEKTPISFGDLQGYYSELGDKLASGNLPGDVYQALKSLQGDIGGMMDKIAAEKGVGSQLKTARNLYRDYMQTFRENTGPSGSGSPIAKSLLAKDPSFALKPLEAEETAARVRNDLARFDQGQDVAGGAPKLFDNFRQAARRFNESSKPVKVPSQPKPPAEMPTQFTPESLAGQKVANIAEAAEKIRKSKSWVVNSLAAYDMIRSGLQGNWGHVGLDIMVRALYSAGKQGIAMALDDPRVVQKLSKLTPEDIAAINKLPPEQRTAFAHSIVPIAEEAAKRGIRINPMLTGLAGLGSVQNSIPVSHPLAQTQPQ